jgi:ribosomal protein S12 methylthiotransferase
MLQQRSQKVHLVSLGCARNLVDSEVMLGSLLKEGWEHTHEVDEADAVIVNTCGFIQSAKEESIDTILNFAEKKRQSANFKLVVTGCLSQRYKTQLAKGLPEVDFFLGTDQFANIQSYLEAPLEKGTVIAKRSHYLYNEDVARVNTLSKHSAYVKVAEGCQHNCAFCIIPAIRGRLRSRTLSSIVNEVQSLVQGGVKEIILIAQDLAAYGRDKGQDDLVPMLKELVSIENLQWVRLLYVYPENITDEFIDLLASEPKIVKYLDIPVQHASDRILKAMNRCLTTEEMTSVFARLRARVPGLAIRTTVMVGFPGETEEDCEELAQFVQAQRFEHLGCFTYSPEEGTVAARMKEQIEDDVKAARFDKIMRLQQVVSAELLKTKIGTHVDAILERFDPNVSAWVGRTSTQAPDIDGTIRVFGAMEAKAGDIVRVAITASSEYDLEGRVV